MFADSSVPGIDIFLGCSSANLRIEMWAELCFWADDPYDNTLMQVRTSDQSDQDLNAMYPSYRFSQ